MFLLLSTPIMRIILLGVIFILSAFTIFAAVKAIIYTDRASRHLTYNNEDKSTYEFAIDVSKKLLEKGWALEDVAKFLDLDVSEINNLQEENLN